MPVPVSGGVSGNLEIGGLAEGPNLFNGLIDDLSISVTPLPAAEIAQIYANAGAGTDLGGSGTEDTLVAGNLIGTDPTGTFAMSNGSEGVDIDAAFGNTIGGTTAAACNIISANADSGVGIGDANDNLVEGDYIGTDATGTIALGNNSAVTEFGAGVLLADGCLGQHHRRAHRVSRHRGGEPDLGQYLRGRILV